MSLIVTVFVREGIVMASDSRMTYNQAVTDSKGQVTQHLGVHFTDTNTKTFVTENDVGISICGDGCVNGEPIYGYMESFLRENALEEVDELPKKLMQYVLALDKNCGAEFYVAGYAPNGEQRLYNLHTKQQKIALLKTSQQGAAWGGVTDVLSRIVGDLYMREEKPGQKVEFRRHMGFPILWPYFTLQDAVDFARFAIQVTEDTLRFQSRIKTVGGPINILVIKPEGARWIAKTELHA